MSKLKKNLSKKINILIGKVANIEKHEYIKLKDYLFITIIAIVIIIIILKFI